MMENFDTDPETKEKVVEHVRAIYDIVNGTKMRCIVMVVVSNDDDGAQASYATHLKAGDPMELHLAMDLILGKKNFAEAAVASAIADVIDRFQSVNNSGVEADLE